MDNGFFIQSHLTALADGLIYGHRNVLEMLALGDSLFNVLNELVKVVEPQIAGMICSILILDESGRRIQSSVGPNVADEYTQMIIGQEIGPNAGSCGTAAYRKEPVVVADTSTDPLWENYRGLAKKFNMRSCWSLPVLSSQGAALGTFAVYSNKVRRPTDFEFRLLKESTHIAAVAIEHSQTRDKLKKTVSLLNATIESTTDGIVVVDRSGKIVSYNKKFCEMWNLSEDHLNGSDDSKALTHVLNQFEHPEAFLAKVLELYNQPEVESFDVLEFKDGRIYERYSKPQRLGDEIVGRVWSFRDVTVQRAQQMEIEAVARAKSQFLANIGHEIRTPVGAILGFAELLTEPNQSEAERQRWAAKIASNGSYLLDVVNELLSLCKAEFDKIQVKRDEISFVRLLSDVADTYQLKAREKGIRLDWIYDGPIPKNVYMDSTKMRQVLSNVIGNAVKFTDKGAVRVTVKPEANQLTFLVQDEGVGIKPQLKERLFKPFSQADASIQKRFGGSGLGLALAQKLARALGGDVELMHSAPGIGSCFRITLDITPPKSKAPRAPSSMDFAEDMAHLDGLKILVVDDSIDNRFLAAKFLSMAGAAVETASDGKEGLNKFLNGHFDIVFMDIMMPEKDGYAATREIREHGFNTPIVAFTAFAAPSEHEKVLAAGFNDYITKPVRRHQLVKCAHSHCRQKNGNHNHMVS
jgi:PAS domain S-box-containing protein